MTITRRFIGGSWLEMGHATTFQPSDLSFLNSALKLRIKAQEFSLAQNIEIPHPVANVLLNSIDVDEKKHEKIVGELLHLLNSGTKKP